MSIYLFLIWYCSISLSYSTFLIEELEDNTSDYFVTSTKIGNSSEEIYKKLNYESLNFEIRVEPTTVLELCIRRGITNLFDERITFKCIGENDNITTKTNLELQELLVLVEGFVITKNKSSFVNGYIKENDFYGTVDTSDTIFIIKNIESQPTLFNLYKNSSNNAIVYKQIKVFDFAARKVKRSTFISNNYKSYRLLIGKG